MVNLETQTAMDTRHGTKTKTTTKKKSKDAQHEPHHKKG